METNQNIKEQNIKEQNRKEPEAAERIFTDSFQENLQKIKRIFEPEKSYDFIEKRWKILSKEAYLLVLNGISDGDILTKILSELQNPRFMENISYPENGNLSGFRKLIKERFSYIEISEEQKADSIIKDVLSGAALLLLEGYSEIILLDVRKYPVRMPAEPDMERVLRGAKDGFVESLATNTTLIRRRIRTPKLRFEHFEVGTDSRTDVVLAYVGGKAEPGLLTEIRDKMDGIDATDLTMGIRSLQELITPKKWFHPMPNVMLTERPDVAASYLEEGYVLLLADNSPSAMIFPCSMFQFTQSPEDYYKSVIVGNYIRLLRFACLFASLFTLPLFLLFTIHYPLPGAWSLTGGEPVQPIKLFITTFIVEIALDLFRYSASHTSEHFAGALSIVGGIIIGEMAVKLNWASTEVLFYGASTLMTSLTLSSLELAEAVRLYRLLLMFAVGLFGLPGLIAGVILILISVATTPVLGGRSYLWPLIPFRFQALKKLLFRYPTIDVQPGRFSGKE